MKKRRQAMRLDRIELEERLVEEFRRVYLTRPGVVGPQEQGRVCGHVQTVFFYFKNQNDQCTDTASMGTHPFSNQN